MNCCFVCRNCKMDKKGYAPVECLVTVNGKRFAMTLERREKPDVFKKLYNSKKTNDLKVCLDFYRTKLYKAAQDMELSGMEISAASLVEFVKNDGFKVYTLDELIKAFDVFQQKRMAAGEITEGVYKKYGYITDRLTKKISKYTELRYITTPMLKEFYSEMRTIYNDSTLCGQMLRLKAMFNYAVENKMLKESPFDFNCVRPKPSKEYLEDFELDKLRNTPIDNEGLNKVRDLALFQAGSGLSYIDMANLSIDMVKVSENGVYYIIDDRHKTGIEYASVFLPDAVEIWNKYNGKLPDYSNQKVNSYLKVIADICGIQKSLHSHLMRKTYGTLLLNSGVRMEVVSKALGHSNVETTRKVYAFLKNQTVINEISDIVVG